MCVCARASGRVSVQAFFWSPPRNGPPRHAGKGARTVQQLEGGRGARGQRKGVPPAEDLSKLPQLFGPILYSNLYP